MKVAIFVFNKLQEKLVCFYAFVYSLAKANPSLKA